jgi:chromosome segregation protein
MNECENSPENYSLEKGKWFTYGGKVDENLMNMLKEAQKTVGIKKFSDFMNDMLKIYRDNKQDTEPPQMQIIKKSVTDIITTTESLLNAMQIIEADKFKSIAEYQQRAQDAEENVLQAEGKVRELEKNLADIKKDLVTAQIETTSAHTELTTEIERKKSIESMINRIQRLADDAVSQKEKAEAERNTALDTAAEAKNKIALLEATNQDMQTRLDAALATIERSQEELIVEKNNNKKLSETLTQETIARNRLEERLQIIEPQFQVTNEKLESLQTEIGNSV